MGLTIPPPVGGLLVAAAVLDFAIGDPFFRWHPVRLIGRSVSTLESWLRRAGADGRIGGCALVALVGSLWSGGVWTLQVAIDAAHPIASAGFHLVCVYFFLALGDLLRHCDKVDLCGNDIAAARQATGKLVGRDTDRMDAAACRRAAVESLAENLVDGFIAPVFWYALAGLPGLVLFKAVSTMDSMVGFRNERYRLFGWCAARSDDLLALVPARLGWLLITLSALVVPKAAGRKACRVAWSQHGVVPGPEPGMERVCDGRRDPAQACGSHLAGRRPGYGDLGGRSGRSAGRDVRRLQARKAGRALGGRDGRSPRDHRVAGQRILRGVADLACRRSGLMIPGGRRHAWSDGRTGPTW